MYYFLLQNVLMYVHLLKINVYKFDIAALNVDIVVGMNPDVDTSFLPDRDREQEEAKIRCSAHASLLAVHLLSYSVFQ